MPTYITKIKTDVVSRRVRIEYRFGTSQEIRDMEFRVVDSREEAINDFYYSFGQLKVLVPDLCEASKDWEYGLTPSALIVSYVGDKLIQGAQIEAKKSLMNAPGTLTIKTPLRFMELPKKGNPATLFSEKAQKMIGHVLELAEGYVIGGHRLNVDLFPKTDVMGAAADGRKAAKIKAPMPQSGKVIRAPQQQVAN